MGSFIAKQPNGLYCRFSSTVDTITHYNMTAEEYIEYCAEQAREDARETLENFVMPFENVKNSFCPYNNTIEEFDTLLKEMGDIEGLGKDRIGQLKNMFKNNED